MRKLFNRLVVPVSFNRSDYWPVLKAAKLANRFGCDLVLLNAETKPGILRWIPFRSFWRKRRAQTTSRQMEVLREWIQQRLQDGLYCKGFILPGNWQTVMKEVVIREHIDLVVLPVGGRKPGNGWTRRISIHKLSEQTNCPILTITRQFRVGRLHRIVVPVGNELSVPKLSVTSYLSQAANSHIFLVGGEDPLNAVQGKQQDYLLKAYQLLNDAGKLDVHCALNYAGDPAEGILDYARDIQADLIVINSGPESRRKGVWNKLAGNSLSRTSEIPVLTVAV